MNCLRKKLRDQAGDALVETLGAVLVAALATLVLMTMLATAVKLIDQSAAEMNAAHQVESDLVQAVTGAPPSAQVVGPLKGSANISLPGIVSVVSVPITGYCDAEGLLLIYAANPGGA
ncbi:MAG: hypothetical protein RR997_03575 [Raoultibacter sp.]